MKYLIFGLASAWLAIGSKVNSETKPIAPTDAVAMACKDVKTLPENVRCLTRYLFLPSATETSWAVLSGHVNGLSTEADIVPVSVIANSESMLGRININDYGWNNETWESLADVDPYFHAKVKVTEESRWIRRQQPRWNGREWSWWDWKEGKTETVKTSLAPWLANGTEQQQSLSELVASTQSQVPIVRGDWFFWQTAIQADRKPGYYDFIGVKNQKDFEKLIGFDAKLAKDTKRVERLEAVAESIVTLNPRRIGRFNSISGGFWKTFDVRTPTEKNNPLRVLDDEFKHDASEEFGPGPNGMMLWGLFAADGTRQDNAPDFIASDETAPRTDRRVHVNLSCIRCHGQKSGIQPIDGWARNLFRSPLDLRSIDHEILKNLRQKYLRDLTGPMQDDRRIYERAIAEATGGWKSEKYAQEYGDFWSAYAEARVDLEHAATDLGVTAEQLRRALDFQLKTTGLLDPVLSVFLVPPERKRTIPIAVWQEAYPLAHLALKGSPP